MRNCTVLAFANCSVLLQTRYEKKVLSCALAQIQTYYLFIIENFCIYIYFCRHWQRQSAQYTVAISNYTKRNSRRTRVHVRSCYKISRCIFVCTFSVRIYNNDNNNNKPWQTIIMFQQKSLTGTYFFYFTGFYLFAPCLRLIDAQEGKKELKYLLLHAYNVPIDS